MCHDGTEMMPFHPPPLTEPIVEAGQRKIVVCVEMGQKLIFELANIGGGIDEGPMAGGVAEARQVIVADGNPTVVRTEEEPVEPISLDQLVG